MMALLLIVIGHPDFDNSLLYSAGFLIPIIYKVYLGKFVIHC